MVLLANGIDLTVILAMGLFVVIPLLLFNAFVEAPVLARWVGSPWKDLVSPLLKANMWSLLAGLPVTILNTALAEWLLPKELVARMHSYPVAIWFWALNYFLFTVLVEYIWFRRRMDVPKASEAGKALFKGVLLANVTSYAVLAPLYWWHAQPRTSVKEFTHDTSWARQPATDVVFINRSNSLSAIHTDGSHLRTVLTNQMVDFVISEDLNTALVRSPSNEYHLCQDGRTRHIDVPSLPVFSSAMDFSPDGTKVALVPFKSGNLFIWSESAHLAIQIPHPDGSTKAVAEGSGDPFARICWSTRDDLFYLTAEDATYEVKVSASSKTGWDLKQLGTNALPAGVARHYARLGKSFFSSVNGPEPSFGHNLIRSEDARSMLLDYKGGGLHASHKNKAIRILDNPGLAHFGQRTLKDPGFTGNYDEIVFRDTENLYLADIEYQKVGRLAPGGAFVLIAPMFCKADAYRD